MLESGILSPRSRGELEVTFVVCHGEIYNTYGKVVISGRFIMEIVQEIDRGCVLVSKRLTEAVCL